MAITFRPLPPEAFPESARPYVAGLNSTLKELCNLEGTLRNPLTTRRSDGTIARRYVEQVHVTRITPDIANVVSGASTVTGTPSVSYASAGAAGTTSTVIPINATLPFPSALMAVSGGSDVVTLISSAGTDTILDFPNTGVITLRGLSSTLGVSIEVPDAEFSISINGDLDSQTSLFDTEWAAGTVDTRSIACIRARYAASATVLGSTICGYDVNAFNLVMQSGSNSDNNMYGIRSRAPTFQTGASNNFGANDLTAGLFIGSRRTSGTWSGSITTNASVIINPPTVHNGHQYGLLIRQQTAQVTANTRCGIMIESQNSGTNRWSIYGTSDRAQFTGPCVVDGEFGTSASVVFSGTSSNNLTQAATLATGPGAFFGVSGTLGSGTSISNITPANQGRMIYLWAASGTMGFSVSNTLRVIGNSINVPPNGAVQAFCTGTTWFVFSPSS